MAVAARDPVARMGIAVTLVSGRAKDLHEPAFTPEDEALLARWSGAERLEWAARIECGKQAAARAMRSHCPTVNGIDAESGVLHVCPGPRNADSCLVVSALRGEYAWAWALAQGIEP